jgi:Fe-S-cluster-containing hydrogenase component 2
MCEVACSSFHSGAVSPAISRIRVAKLEEIGIDVAVACVSCAEKACLVCPNDALTVADSGVILLDEDLCDSCQLCVDACPIGAVGYYDGLPLFCDLCGGETVCVDVCPNGSLVCDDSTEISLDNFRHLEGIAARRRADYVRAISKPVRQSWIDGVRVDS